MPQFVWQKKSMPSLLRMRGIKWLTYRKVRFFTTLILLFIIFGGILYAIRYGFEVKRIEFIAEGMEVKFNERLITGNIIFFPSERIRNTLLREYPQLKDVVIRKQFPHTIVIIPVLRNATALLVTQKATYGIDQEGRVIGIGMQESHLPEIEVNYPSVRVGTTLEDQSVRTSLLFLDKSKPLFSVSKIQAMGDSLSLKAISDKTEILFTQDADIDTLISTLQTIITGVRIKGTMPKVIDVRFTKPVIQW